MIAEVTNHAGAADGAIRPAIPVSGSNRDLRLSPSSSVSSDSDRETGTTYTHSSGQNDAMTNSGRSQSQTERQRKTERKDESKAGEGINTGCIPPKGPHHCHHRRRSIVQLYTASRPKCLFPVTVSAKLSPTRSTSMRRSPRPMITAMTANVKVVRLIVCPTFFSTILHTY